MNENNTNFLNSKFGYSYKDLYNPLRLKALTEDFYKYFESKDKEKFDNFIKYRDSKGIGFTDLQISNVLIDSSYFLSDFIVELFQLGNEQKKFIDEVDYEKEVLIFKKEFVQRKVFKKYKKENLSEFNWLELDSFASEIKQAAFSDYDFEKDEEKFTAKMILELDEIEKNYRWFYEGDKFAPENFQIPDNVKAEAERILSSIKSAGILNQELADAELSDLNYFKFILSELQKWIFAKKYSDHKVKNWVSYFEPHKLDYSHLVKYELPNNDFPELMQAPSDKQRPRFGFKLTDPRMDKRQILNQVDYCMYCHDRDKDSCSKGLLDRFGNKKFNPLGIELDGCPLNEKISEMHYVRKNGFPIASLSLVIIDNPNVPGTGHRICNDCMKGCIFQTQEPVNIPQIETSVLTDVFKLPYGYEIYSLLTRWNPLNIKRPYALPYNGMNVMVVGMGPAGYTLSHYLLNEGFGVVGIDALKIEKVHQDFCGIKNEKGFAKFPKPIKYFYNEVEEELDKRILQGFGGVSEYGITVRWDKNFLTAIYINISRRNNFRLYDGVRFGGTITIEDAWDLGFDHIAIATGAGKPTIINMKNNLIRGIRKASDFLMALQLTGAAKENNLANLQVQLPAIVIGGGLTAIDTATELLAYYPVQVLKALKKYEETILKFGEESFWNMFDDEEKKIMKTFIEHGKEVKAEQVNAKSLNKKPNLIPLLKKWGGVTIVYRKRLVESPAYRLNHEEVIEALDEGIYFAENLVPAEAVSNEYGAVDEIIFELQKIAGDQEKNILKFAGSGEMRSMKAKSVMVAAGTSPNIIYEDEFPGTFELDDRNYFFKPYKFFNNTLTPVEKNEVGFFTSYNKDGKYISYYGDNHPKYAGNVVKAMASAKDGYEKVVEIFAEEISGLKNDVTSLANREENFSKLISKLNDGLVATVEEVVRLTPTIVEVIVKAPFAAKKFHPGQFYRLQNYEMNANKISGAALTMEGLAMTGAWTDVEKGLLSLIVLEMGVSSRLCADLKTGERVVVMGPTGTPTEIPKDETVLLAGGGLGNAVLFSIAEALKKNNNRVIYFAGYKNSSDVYKMNELEKGSDQVIWSNEFGEKIIPRRDQDLSFKGNIIEAMKTFDNDDLGKKLIDFKDVNRIIAIGSDSMMNAVKISRHTIFKDRFRKHIAIGSINSSMQCMMKEICAQCLQRHVDPVTGEESFVFSCFNQDQLLDEVDFQNLNQRLKTNSVMEKLGNFYLTYLLSNGGSKKENFKVLEKHGV
ncbi:MAG: FAD-dependent oxidoreductase [Bacteroidota bacterium]|nr:FAD-dependent oxidoreductase [Bacteroidota bacterium]